MLLGAAHGATQWEPIEEFVLEEGELRCEIPYAGIFCGFTRCLYILRPASCAAHTTYTLRPTSFFMHPISYSPVIEDLAAVRFYIFTMPELPRDDPTSLRVHLCPDLADQVKQMEP